MNFFNNPDIDNHPLVQCIRQTNVLCEKNKKLLYKELKISGIYAIKNLIINDISLPTQEDRIRIELEKILPYNEPAIDQILQEYKSLKYS